MPDVFTDHQRRPTDPVITVFNSTPEYGADLLCVTVALNVATPGTVRVITVDGLVSDVQIHPGHAFPLRAKRVWLTGTSVTGIRGLVQITVAARFRLDRNGS